MSKIGITGVLMAIKVKSKIIKKHKGQMELDFNRPLERGRHEKEGGISFYFFDFDDNVAFLGTPIIIFDKKDGHEKILSSGEFARFSKTIGDSGLYKDYFLNFNEESGSFKFFRDKKITVFDKMKNIKQSFVEDLQKAIEQPGHYWKAPSWTYFYHAILNNRPISVITARGHEPETIQDGIKLLVNEKHLPQSPNYLSLFPVSNSRIQKELGYTKEQVSIPDLKRLAIRKSVEIAFEKYGHNPFHRFGMSDDDPHNIELITEEMKDLKADYPDNSFYVIQTFEDKIVKREITNVNYKKVMDNPKLNAHDQLDLLL
jgi:hypothetical protein